MALSDQKIITLDLLDEYRKKENAVIEAGDQAVDAKIGTLSTLTTDVKTDVVAAINEVDAHADANATAIAVLNDADTVEGSVAKAVKTAKDAVEAKIGTVPSSVGETTTDTVVAYINAKVAEATGDASKVAEDLAAEIERATGVEEGLDTAVKAAQKAADDEKTRAEAAEKAITDTIGIIPEGSTVANEIAKSEQSAKDYTDTEIGKLGSVFNFKGVVADVASLPKAAKVGDVYHVTAKSAEYVCITASTESADAVYEELGSVIDLSAYETIEGAESKIATAKGEAIAHADALDEAMDARMDVVEAAIGEGGGVAEQIKTAIEALDSNISVAEGNDFLTGVTITDGKLTAATSDKLIFATTAEVQALFD